MRRPTSRGGEIASGELLRGHGGGAAAGRGRTVSRRGLAFLTIALGLLLSTPDRGFVRGECIALDEPFQVLDVHIECDPEDWDLVLHDRTFAVEVPAVFRCGDEALLPVNVRRKRSAAIPSELDPRKVSLKIDFDDAVREGHWHGHRKLVLETGVHDVSVPSAIVREGIAWILTGRAGVIAGGAAWVRLHVNGGYAGLYLRVEEIDKRFLRRRLGDDTGFLYKLDHWDEVLRKRLTRVGEPDPQAESLCFPPFDSLCEPPVDGAAELRRHLDIRQLLELGATSTLLGNTDGLLEADNNYFWYNSSRPRVYFPWDLDLALHPGSVDRFPHVSEVERQLFLLMPPLRKEFDRAILRLLDDLLSPAAVDELVQGLSTALGPALEGDPYHGLPNGVPAEFEDVRVWLLARADFLRKHLPPQVSHPIVLNEILVANRTGIRDEGGEAAPWVEIVNRGSTVRSLAGLYLSNDPADPLAWPLPEVALSPGGRLLIWCDGDTGEGAYHAPFRLDEFGGAVGLAESIEGVLRTVDFVRYGTASIDESRGRPSDGAPGHGPLACPTPLGPNGAPCAVPAGFLRGDLDSSAAIELADALALLAGLFGSAPLPCLDAADANDDGKIGVPDAIGILRHLFAGEFPLPPPRGECGLDPTPDPLDCTEFPACEGESGNQRVILGPNDLTAESK